MRRIRCVAFCVVALVVLAPAVAVAKVIGSKSSSGDFAVVVASGHARHPHAMYVRVSTKPSQHATGSWTVVCSKGTGAGSKSGDFAGSGSFRRKVRFPNGAESLLGQGMRHPSDCTVSAAAQLDDSGKVRVTLTAR